MNYDLHSHCETCLGPLYAPSCRACANSLSHIIVPLCPWRSSGEWIGSRHCRRMMSMAAGLNATDNFWMSFPLRRGVTTQGMSLLTRLPPLPAPSPSSPVFPVEVLEFCTEKEAPSAPTPFPSPAAGPFPCNVLSCDLPVIIHQAASQKEVLMPPEPPAPVHGTMMGDFYCQESRHSPL